MHRWTLGSLRALPLVGLLAAGLAASPATPVAASQSPGTWAKTGSMTAATEQQTATLLQNGQVLMSGTAELYNPLPPAAWRSRRGRPRSPCRPR